MKKGKPDSEVIFDGGEYRISKVSLNFVIECKRMLKNKKGNLVKMLSDPFYSPEARGVGYAHETARYIIDKALQECSLSAG